MPTTGLFTADERNHSGGCLRNAIGASDDLRGEEVIGDCANENGRHPSRLDISRFSTPYSVSSYFLLDTPSSLLLLRCREREAAHARGFYSARHAVLVLQGANALNRQLLATHIDAEAELDRVALHHSRNGRLPEF